MGQLKVSFTIQNGSERASFTSRFDMEQQLYFELLMERFIDLEIRMKQAAAEHWLIQRLGQDTLLNLKIHHTSDLNPSSSVENKKNPTLDVS